MISLVCASCVFMITCQNIELADLEVSLHDEKVYRLQPFNAKHFDEPDAGVQVITNITLQDKRSAAGRDKEKRSTQAEPKAAENA